MIPFLNEDFLLKTEAARRLYHDHAAKMPIIDYHCHIDPADIAENRRFSSITDLWLGADHYKWRLIRANGVPESGVTGAREQDKFALFQNFAAALPRAVGSPVYHWAHLELKRYFGIETPLTPQTARQIYDACNQMLARPEMDAHGLIRQSRVKLICTTDDPADDLAMHARIAREGNCPAQVLPAFRPDNALQIEKPGFSAYLEKLGRTSGTKITSLEALLGALDSRVAFFHGMGCRASDHGLESCFYAPADPARVDGILRAALSGAPISQEEALMYKTAVLLHLARRYRQHGWAMQIHFGVMRNNNTRMHQKIGPDTGFDAMNGQGRPHILARFLDALDCTDQLPRTVLYSLNPQDSEILASIAGCFMAEAGCPGKIQLGAAWWFNDTKSGMEKQLLDYANSSLLGNFVGMLTDSRSFLSYTRHEYFRRILCNFLGRLVEDGEYPADFETLGAIAEDICFYNTARFFGFSV